MRWDTADLIIQPGSPANLRHPLIAWIAEHARLLVSDYPAIFARLWRGLVAVAEIRPFENVLEASEQDLTQARQLATAGADQINLAIASLRKLFLGIPALEIDVQASDYGALFTDWRSDAGEI
jgi:hypothetical protein